MELLDELKNPFLIADTGFDGGALTGTGREGLGGTETGAEGGVGRGSGLDGFIAATGSCEINKRREVYLSIQRDKNLT